MAIHNLLYRNPPRRICRKLVIECYSYDFNLHTLCIWLNWEVVNFLTPEISSSHIAWHIQIFWRLIIAKRTFNLRNLDVWYTVNQDSTGIHLFKLQRINSLPYLEIETCFEKLKLSLWIMEWWSRWNFLFSSPAVRCINTTWTLHWTTAVKSSRGFWRTSHIVSLIYLRRKLISLGRDY